MTLFINMISGRIKVLLFDNHNSRIKHFSFVCKDLLFVRHVSTANFQKVTSPPEVN